MRFRLVKKEVVLCHSSQLAYVPNCESLPLISLDKLTRGILPYISYVGVHVPPLREWVFSRFGLKTDIGFASHS